MTPHAPVTAEPDRASPAAWATIAAFLLIGLYMYCDRHVMVLQTDRIKASLSLSDFQVGLVQGLGVAIFASLVGYPIAWLADRFSRRLVLALCVLAWTGAVIASALAQSFAVLFLATAVVGAGEAGLIPISYAVIPELFAGRARLLANSIMTVVGRLGSGIVIALSGQLAQHAGAMRPFLPAAWQGLEDWRLALLAVAAPGPLFLLIVAVVRLYRPSGPAATSAAARPPAAPVWPFLSRNLAMFACFYAGIGLFIFGTSAFGAFLPVVAMRQMGASPGAVGAGFGVATLVSTLIALLLVTGGGRWLQLWWGARYPIWLLLLASIMPAAFAPLFLLTTTPTQIYLLLGVNFLFLAGGTMVFPTALQDLTPAPSRARLASISIMINIAFSALAPVAVGALSDQLKGRANGLMLATVGTAMAALVLSAALLFLCVPRYLATIAAARDEEARV
ncbi:MFS transporter [uncultured Sphingomonas sp.]|uniref:MFS transporter n=1 Tax=uncultured Sphingomonas sp. TaxID=158754 RepID=UPI0035C97AE0